MKSDIKNIIFEQEFLISCNSSSIKIFKLQTFSICGENEYPLVNNEEIELTRVYFNVRPTIENKVSEFDGGYILMSKSTISSVKFDKKIYFTKTFSDVQLQDILLLYEKYVLVYFKNEKYFEIYNIFNGNFILKQVFEEKIKLILSQIENKFIISMRNYSSSEICVILEKGQFQKFSINMDNLNIQLTFDLAPTGFECCHAAYENDGTDKSIDNVILTFIDGSICYINNTSIDANKVTYLFRKNKTKKLDPLTVKSFSSSGVLFISKNGNLYFCSVEELKTKQMRMIPGRFQNGKIYKKNLAASSFGSVYCYYIKEKLENDMHTVLLYAKFAAHVEDIIYLEFAGICK